VESDFLKSDIGRSIQSFLQTFSHEDDLSDVSVYFRRDSPTTATSYVVCDLSDGPKTCLNLGGKGYRVGNEVDEYAMGPITVDGVSTAEFPSTDAYQTGDDAGDVENFIPGYPIRYDDTLKVEYTHNGSGKQCIAYALVLGSGPHSVAVVKDGEPVYMTAENVSEETMEGMGVPDGYKVVKDPEIDHPNPQIRGMWDDDKEEVVDHPYWKPFHDTLDRLDGMRRRVGTQAVIEKIERNPTPFENVLEGENPMEDPVEEAVQFWYERESERTTELEELEELRS